MWWPFRKKNDDTETIRNLRRELDDAWETATNARQGRYAAEAAMEAMQKPLTEAGLDEIANRAAAEIADIYAAGGSGVRTRDIQVHAVVRGAVRKAAVGEKAWNEGALAAAAYRSGDA